MREPWGRIVWDIETVPDLPGFAAAKGLEGKNDDEIRVHLATNFLSTSTTRSYASVLLSRIESQSAG